jgi:asparagine synthase (glutamine-hydrolysing)
MCGIAGALGFSEISKQHFLWVEEAVRLQSHRGPDFDAVIRCSEKVVLGHNRLSILDLDERSHQPFSKDNEHWLVFNGEIYNYRQLAKNYDLKCVTESDTEVLWDLLKILPIERVLKEINGMFAFVFYSVSEGNVVLARDRFGIKPLHLLRNNDGLFFSSELRPLISRSGKKLNSTALSEYLLYQAPLQENDLIDGISRLMPGEALRVDLNSGNEKRLLWYKPNLAETPDETDLKSVFQNAVQRRMISDVPIGAFLSGGIDSTAVVTAMCSVSSSDVHTFNVRFPDFESTDSDLAQKTAEILGTHHTAIELSKKEIISMIPDLVQSMDVPSPDAVNTGIVSKKTKEAGITVALSGVGGDEFFGGYPSFKRFQKLKKTGFLKPFVQLTAEMLALSGKRSFQKSARMLRHGENPEMVTALSRLLFLPEEVETLGLRSQVDYKLVATEGFRGISDAELYYYTIPLLLRDADQMSMQHALEVRVPFFDHKFVEFIRSRGDHYFTPTQVAKSYMIEALSPDFPTHVTNQPKTGFVLPMDRWMKGELREFTLSGLHSERLTLTFPSFSADELWNQFLSGKLLWSQLWSLSVLGHWMETHRISA